MSALLEEGLINGVHIVCDLLQDCVLGQLLFYEICSAFQLYLYGVLCEIHLLDDSVPVCDFELVEHEDAACLRQVLQDRQRGELRTVPVHCGGDTSQEYEGELRHLFVADAHDSVLLKVGGLVFNLSLASLAPVRQWALLDLFFLSAFTTCRLV